MQLAKFADRLLEVIALAHRDTARGDQHIPFGSRQAQGIAAGRQGVGKHTIVVQLHAPAFEQSADAEAVDVVDLPGRQRFTGLAQLIAAAQQAHAQTPVHRDFGHAKAGQQAQFLGAQTTSRLQQRIAPAQLLTTQTHMATEAHCGQDHPLAFDTAVLLGDHTVGSRRQWRTGENANGVPGWQRFGRRITGGDTAGQRQCASVSGKIGRAQGVAVHRAVVPGRLVLGCLQVFRQHPIQRRCQRHSFHPRWRRNPLQQSYQRFVDRAQVMPRTSAAAHARLPQQRISAWLGRTFRCGTKLHGRVRLSSWPRRISFQAVRQAPGEPGRQQISVPLLIPARARDWMVEAPISAWETWRNSSPKPSTVRSSSGATACGVLSRRVKPVPPVIRPTCTLGSAIHAETTARMR
ncbi:hypothetical protein D3C81_1186260 [compost metagenome]